MINQIFNVVVVYQEVEELFNRIDREQNGKLDVLVNNAYAGKLSNPEYIHLKVNETINYKKTVLFYSSCIYSLCYISASIFGAYICFPVEEIIVEETLSTHLKIIDSVLRIFVFL